VVREFGKGKVVYFAAGLDAAYYSYAYPYQRLAMKQAINWVTKATAPISVRAPMCVHSTLMHQKTGKTGRLIAHLFNDVNTTAGHAFPNDDVPLREEVLPIHGIELTFSPKFPIGRIHVEPDRIDLVPNKQETGTMVVVPRLDVHTMVVVELNP
jgi:hypothetical protein